MIHPLVRLIVNEPELLAEHLAAYAELIGSEAQHVRSRVAIRVLMSALALCCIGVAAVLAGVALMLWAITPNLSQQAEWALIAAPAIPALVAMIAGLIAKRPPAKEAFAAVHEQVMSDLQMLKEVGAR